MCNLLISIVHDYNIQIIILTHQKYTHFWKNNGKIVPIFDVDMEDDRSKIGLSSKIIHKIVK